MAKLRLGVSACLLGREVRYDGRHRRDAFVADVLGPLVERVPVCPELEIGLFVRALGERMAWLPIEEEARLQDPAARARFVDRVLARARSKQKRLDPELRALMLRAPPPW
jgi:uncharacterized protein YbbK (DUF523 family)